MTSVCTKDFTFATIKEIINKLMITCVINIDCLTFVLIGCTWFCLDYICSNSPSLTSSLPCILFHLNAFLISLHGCLKLKGILGVP